MISACVRKCLLKNSKAQTGRKIPSQNTDDQDYKFKWQNMKDNPRNPTGVFKSSTKYAITRHRQVNVRFQRHWKISMNNILLSSSTTSLHEFNDISNVECLWSVVIDVQCIYRNHFNESSLKVTNHSRISPVRNEPQK